MTTDTQAAVAAALMQAADAFAGDDNLSRLICCNGQDCGCQGATAADYVQYQLRALITPDAMAALDAVKAEARKVNIPTDIAAAVLKIGRVEWGATDPKSEAEHISDFTDTLRLTCEHFGTEGPQRLDGLYVEGSNVVICHTGTSPNSGVHAQALTGAWNRLYDEARILAALDKP